MAHTNSQMPNYIIHGLVHKHQAVKMQWGGWGVGGWGRWIWIGHTPGYSQSAAWHHAACSASKTKLKSVGCSGSWFTNSTVMRLHGCHKWCGINLETYTMSTCLQRNIWFSSTTICFSTAEGTSITPPRRHDSVTLLWLKSRIFATK